MLDSISSRLLLLIGDLQQRFDFGDDLVFEGAILLSKQIQLLFLLLESFLELVLLISCEAIHHFSDFRLKVFGSLTFGFGLSLLRNPQLLENA